MHTEHSAKAHGGGSVPGNCERLKKEETNFPTQQQQQQHLENTIANVHIVQFCATASRRCG